MKNEFNPDTDKQAQEVIFSHKVKVTVYSPLVFTITLYMKLQLKSILERFSISS